MASLFTLSRHLLRDVLGDYAPAKRIPETQAPTGQQQRQEALQLAMLRQRLEKGGTC